MHSNGLKIFSYAFKLHSYAFKKHSHAFKINMYACNGILSEHVCLRLKYISMLPEFIRILSKHSYTIKKLL